MKLRRTLRLSMRSLAAHRVRTAIALASVGAGVTAVVLTSAIGQGAENDVDAKIQSLGANLLIVRPAQVKPFVARQAVRGAATTLTLADYAVVKALSGVAAAAPGLDAAVKVKAGRTTTTTTVRGTLQQFPIIRRFQLRSGRFFDDADDREGRRVAVLGARVADALFDGDPSGRQIRIRGVPFEVIGVLAAKGVLADGDEDNQVLVPLRTALRRVLNVTWLTTIYVSATEASVTPDLETSITRALGARHRLGVDGAADFEVQNAARYFALQRMAAQSIKKLTAGIGAIALLVGGTGVMAFMWMSVKERTNEIGLRMAVGARPRDVVTQLLMESTALALGGWLGGVVLAALGAGALVAGTGWVIAPPTQALVISLVMTLVAGLGFGAVPAQRAAMIAPMAALRSQ